MLKGANKIYLGSALIKKVMLGSVMIHPAVVSVARNVHYDTGANTYQGWSRYNVYHYRDVLTWSDGTLTYENARSENTLTKANAYTEANTLKSQGTTFWRLGWDKYRSDTYQMLRTREDNYQEWVGDTSTSNILIQSNAYAEARTHKTIGTTFWASGWDKYRTDIYQTLRTAFDGYQEWVGVEEQVSVLVESNAYTLGSYFHESNTATGCVSYGVAPYQTGYRRVMARNKVRFDGYQEFYDRYTESNWQIVASNVEACGYNPAPTVYINWANPFRSYGEIGRRAYVYTKSNGGSQIALPVIPKNIRIEVICSVAVVSDGVLINNQECYLNIFGGEYTSDAVDLYGNDPKYPYVIYEITDIYVPVEYRDKINIKIGSDSV